MPPLNLGSSSNSTSPLRDGRILGLVEYGDCSGKALFYLHGYPGSRVEARLLCEPAEEFGVRLIGVDRPGMGLSTFKAGRRLLDWPADLAELADQLGIDRFSVVGCSGGAPYAIACARKIPDRLSACGIVAGAGVAGPFLSLLSHWVPWLLTPVFRPFLRNEEQAARSLRLFAGRWAEPDRKAVHTPQIGETLAASLAEAFRQGSRGPAYEATLLGSSWGFKLEDIRYSNLHLWHGELDKQVPIAMGRAVAAGIRGCKANYYPDEGHISLIVNRGKEIVQALLDRP
jgi:pimeloyl-ACP methyl ester carboxylesterase